MTSTIRELIVQDMLTALEEVREDNGYDITFEKVYRTAQTSMSSSDYPCVVLYEDAEEYTDGNPAQFTHVILHAQIIVMISQLEELAETVTVAVASIFKALYADQTRGGNAIDTSIIDSEMFTPQETIPLGGVRVAVDVKYRHFLGNPYENR